MRDHKADSHFIGHEPCPKCGSKDNLARYSDGHGYCFSTGCEYWESGEEEMQLQAPQVVHLEKMTAVYRGYARHIQGDNGVLRVLHLPQQ